MAKRHDPHTPLRRYLIQDAAGKEHVVEAHFCFDNSHEGRGLLLRRIDSDGSTKVVGTWAPGFWASFRELA